MKRTLAKVNKDDGDPYLAMLCLRSTHVDYQLPSPAEMLQCRIFRDNLPKIVKRGEEEHISRLQQKQMSQSHHHKHAHKTFNQSCCSQDVTLQHPTTKRWQPAVVKEVRDQPRSYDIMTSTGAEFRRNRSQIRERAMPAKPTPVASDQLQEVTTTRSGRIIKTPQRLDL